MKSIEVNTRSLLKIPVHRLWRKVCDRLMTAIDEDPSANNEADNVICMRNTICADTMTVTFSDLKRSHGVVHRMLCGNVGVTVILAVHRER